MQMWKLQHFWKTTTKLKPGISKGETSLGYALKYILLLLLLYECTALVQYHSLVFHSLKLSKRKFKTFVSRVLENFHRRPTYLPLLVLAFTVQFSVV